MYHPVNDHDPRITPPARRWPPGVLSLLTCVAMLAAVAGAVHFAVDQLFVRPGDSHTMNQASTMFSAASLAAADPNQVQIVMLAGADVTDADVARLAEMPNLQIVNLSETSVTDRGLRHLAELPNLRYLYLVDTAVTDAGLAHLQTLTSLKSLNVDNTAVTDAGLARVRHLPNLTRISNDRVARDATATR